MAETLGDTPTISRKSHVHPALLDLAEAGGLRGEDRSALLRRPRPTKYLSSAERGWLAFLQAPAEERNRTAEAA